MYSMYVQYVCIVCMYVVMQMSVGLKIFIRNTDEMSNMCMNAPS